MFICLSSITKIRCTFSFFRFYFLRSFFFRNYSREHKKKKHWREADSRTFVYLFIYFISTLKICVITFVSDFFRYLVPEFPINFFLFSLFLHFRCFLSSASCFTISFLYCACFVLSFLESIFNLELLMFPCAFFRLLPLFLLICFVYLLHLFRLFIPFFRQNQIAVAVIWSGTYFTFGLFF